MTKEDDARSTYHNQDGCHNCKNAINENAGGMEAEYRCPLMHEEESFGWAEWEGKGCNYGSSV